jgi:hypothetical protein
MFYKPAFQWASIALLIRLILGLLIHNYSLQSGFKGFVPMSNYGDDILYWDLAEQMRLGYDTGYTINLYPMFLAVLFQITGPSILLAKMVNMLFNVVAIFVTILIVKEVGEASGLDRRQTRWAGHMTGALLALYPSQIFYAVQMIKDPFLIFAGTINLYLAILILRGKGRKTWNLSGWFLTMLGVVAFRPYTLIALVGSWLIYLLFVWKTKISRKIAVLVVVFLIVGVVPYFAGLGFFASNYIAPWLDVEKVSEFRKNGYSTGGSAADITIDYSSPITFIQTYGFSVLTAMFGPFPWQVKSPIQIIALPEALFALAMSLVLLVPLGKARRKTADSEGRSVPYILLIFSLVLVGLIGLFSDSIGGNTRLRILSWNIFFAYSAIVFAGRYVSSKKSALSLKRS